MVQTEPRGGRLATKSWQHHQAQQQGRPLKAMYTSTKKSADRKYTLKVGNLFVYGAPMHPG
jgi:hypothetical protein